MPGLTICLYTYMKNQVFTNSNFLFCWQHYSQASAYALWVHYDPSKNICPAELFKASDILLMVR